MNIKQTKKNFHFSIQKNSRLNNSSKEEKKLRMATAYLLLHVTLNRSERIRIRHVWPALFPSATAVLFADGWSDFDLLKLAGQTRLQRNRIVIIYYKCPDRPTTDS